MPRTTPRFATLFGRALLRRCVVCGERGVVRHLLQLSESCPRCGLRFNRKEGHFIGAIGLSTVLTFGALLMVLIGGIILSYPDLAVVPIIATGIGVAIAMPVLIHSHCRLIWTAIDLVMQPLEPGEAPLLTPGVES